LELQAQALPSQSNGPLHARFLIASICWPSLRTWALRSSQDPVIIANAFARFWVYTIGLPRFAKNTYHKITSASRVPKP